MDLEKVTEEESRYHDLEKMTIHEILTDINREDKTVPEAVEKAIPQMEQLVAAITDKLLAGGRLFYIGAGTSGRLGVLDASEIPPPMVCLLTWSSELLREEKQPSADRWKMRRTTGSKVGRTWNIMPFQIRIL